MAGTDQTSDVSALTVQLLSAYLANNTVPSEELAELIRTTKDALAHDTPSPAEAVEPEVFTPAVTAGRSLASPEHIISLIDGKPYKTLKRHLASRGLTPNQYRSRYDLPASYPMVAPAYAEQRREVAHRLGLGRKGPKPESAREQAIPMSDDKPEKQPSAERAPDETGAPTPGKGKRASSEKPPAARRGRPRGKVADPDLLKTAAGAQGDVLASKPAKRRGKIGLFKSASDEAAKSATDADEGAPDAVVEAGEGTVPSGGAPARSSAKTRAPKRMARVSKPGAS